MKGDKKNKIYKGLREFIKLVMFCTTVMGMMFPGWSGDINDHLV